MNHQLIGEAMSVLQLASISLGPHSVSIPYDFNPLNGLEPTFVNLQWGPKRAQMATLEGGEGTEPQHLWRIWFKTLTRYATGTAPESGDVAESAVFATVDAEWLVQYRFPQDRKPSDDALREFATHNVAIHVWPYWREWLQSTAQRTGLPMHLLEILLPKANAATTVAAASKALE